MKADVLIVGAGPAGLAAARELALGGAKVMVIDRHLRPGGKACGGGLTAEAWQLCEIDPMHPWAGMMAFDSLRVHAPVGQIDLQTENPLLIVVDRMAWIGRMIDSIARLGCEFRLGERLLSFEHGIAITDRERIHCDFIVGCDGARSRVRKGLGLPVGSTMRAIQIELEKRDSSLAPMPTEMPAVWFDPPRFGTGYGWLFPAYGQIRIGCGVDRAVAAAAGLNVAFNDWLVGLGIDRTRGRMRAGTIGCGYLGHRFGQILLAGDAAGLASPVTGEGIAQALLSGREVAREILSPGYRSSALTALAARHRRTHSALALSGFGSVLYRLAPALLRLPLVGAIALQRYAAVPANSKRSWVK